LPGFLLVLRKEADSLLFMDVMRKEGGYTELHKLLHWLLALLVVGQLAMGLLAEDVRGLMWWHKSVGALILVLVLVRSVPRLTGGAPKPGDTAGPGWQRGIAFANHMALYVCLLAMPLSGWVMSNAGGRGVSFFGLFNLPRLLGQDEAVQMAAYGVHDTVYKLLIALMCLHVGAALYHHFVRKDGTLKRILP
jgi:cytochrome b561